MPGLNFVYSFDDDFAQQKPEYQKALEKTLFEEPHYIHTIFEGTGYVLSSTQYEGYPIRTFQKDGLNICLEGKIYNRDQHQFETELVSHVKHLLAEEADSRKDYSKWLSNIDGDFIIVVVDDSSGKVLVLNDIFSSLPIYIHQTDSRVVVSRNYRFVAGMISDKKIDRLAVAQFLHMEYMLGDRTYLKGVCRVKPAEVVLIDKSSRKVSREVVHTFNFEQKKHRNRSVKRNAKELVPLFIEACRTRIDPNHKTIVSQSGGLDSRAVAAGIYRCDAKFKSMTILDENKIYATDVRISQKIAANLSAEFEILEPGPDRPENMIRVLKMRSGLSYIGKVHEISLFDKIAKEYGHNATLFTGVGGEKVGRDLRPRKKLRSVEQLAELLINSGNLLDLETAAAIAGVTKEAVFNEMVKELKSYPEKRADHKIIHFYFYARAFKWQFEGNDRRRHLFWTAYPMLSTKFFKYFMNCPDNQKRNLRLYATFLKYLEPKIADLPVARNGFIEPYSLFKHTFLAWDLFIEMLRWPKPIRFVFKKIKKLVKNTLMRKKPEIQNTYAHSEDLFECIRKQVTETADANDYIDVAKVQNLLDNADKYNHEALAYLLTAMSAIESLMTDNCTIEQYLDADLGNFDPDVSKRPSFRKL